MKIKPSQMHVVLTGASGGIGFATANRLSRAGAQIIALGRNEESLKALMATLEPNDQFPHCYFPVDLCEPTQRRKLITQLALLPVAPNVLVNMAGTNQLSLFEDQSEEAIRGIIETNLTASMLLTQELLPALKQLPWARVINVGSTFGSIGYPGYVSYCTSKFALRGFSQSLNREMADSRVRVCYFAPRATRTGLNSDAAYALNTELNNTVDSPEKVAKALVTFLCGNHTSRYLGWPEKLFIRINSLFPTLVTNSIVKQLKIIKSHAQSGP